MRLFFLLIFVALFTHGCTTVPFKETARVSMKSIDPQTVVADFRQKIPERFQILNSVVFEYNSRDFLGMGYLEINRADNSFKVVCMNPMGVKLFDLSGDRTITTTHYAIEPLQQYGDLPAAVAGDIRRIYFDLLPEPDSIPSRNRHDITFRHVSGPESMEYVYAGPDHDLVRKTYYENNEIVWRISYYEYQAHNGKHYPQGIVLIHYKHGYQLTVRQKELNS